MSRFSNDGLTFKTFRKAVTSSGTPVQLSDAATGNVLPDGITAVIKGWATNTGMVHVGATAADAIKTGTASFRISGNQAVEIQVHNLADVYIDADVSGEGVDVLLEKNKAIA